MSEVSISRAAAPSRTVLDERTIVLTRLLNAPRSVVFKAWTEADRMAQWWGPKGFTAPVCEVDARPGGAVYIVMRSPDGVDYPSRGVFRELVAPARIVFETVAEDDDERPKLEAHTTITFEDEGGKTKVTVEATAVALSEDAAPMLAGMDQGWSGTLDKMVAYIDG